MDVNSVIGVSKAISNANKIRIWKLLRRDRGLTLHRFFLETGLDKSYILRILDELIMAGLCIKRGYLYYLGSDKIEIRRDDIEI